jgi:hypothetical protein
VTGPVRPTEGDRVTVLIEVAGVPVTHVGRAGTVRGGTLFVPRKPGDQRWAVDEQGPATILFTHNGRLFMWPMRVEEVLPSSYYLVSNQDPSEGERRGFVRAPVSLRVRLSRHDGPRQPWLPVEADLSSAGMRVPCGLTVEPGDLLDISLRVDGAKHDVSALARVVRRLEDGEGGQVAIEFVQLGSADEERLQQLVFRAREQDLIARIGRRDFT